MVDYSKWDHLQSSEDEGVEQSLDVDALEAEIKEKKDRLLINKNRITEIENMLANEEDQNDQNELAAQLEQLRKENVEIQAELNDSYKKQKRRRKTYNKSMLNMQAKKTLKTEKTVAERGQEFKAFIQANEKLCREYGLLRNLRDSKCFLEANLQLVCDHTSNYLGLWSLNLQLAGKNKLVSRVAHQHMVMQYILKLALTLNVDSRSSIDSFFATIQNCSLSYREQFELEIRNYKEIIKNRAIEKREEVLQEYQRQERAERLGPGGLDPLEVLESLPHELRVCFEKSDVQLLTDTIAAMPVELADYHMKRCTDAGLWLPYSEEDEVTPAPATAPPTDTTKNTST